MMIKNPAIALALSMGACGTITQPDQPDAVEAPPVYEAKPPCLGNLLLQDENQETPCDVIPPQTLSFIFDGLDDNICLDAGGVIYSSPSNGLRICFDIDY